MPRQTSETLSSTSNTIPGWETKQLSEVCEIERGGSPRPIDSFLTNDPSGINWIKIGDTKGITKYIYQTQEKIRPEGARRSRLVVEGDFILSNSMSFGRPYIMKTTGCIHDGWLLLRPKEPRINQDFLYYVLGSNLIFRQFDSLAAGSTVRNLNIGLVKTVRIPVPPQREQERIVAILDEAFAGIAKVKANAEKNLESLSLLANAAGFPAEPILGKKRHTLDELCEFIVDCEHKTAPTQAEGIPSIRTPNIGRGILILEGVNRVSEETYREWTRRAEPAEGDLIFAREAPAGNVAVVPPATKLCLGQRTVLLRPKRQLIDSAFLAHLILHPATQQRWLGHSRGATVQHVNLKDIRALSVGNLPPLQEQVHAVKRIDALSEELEKSACMYKREIAALDELRQSLLHQAFSGNL